MDWLMIVVLDVMDPHEEPVSLMRSATAVECSMQDAMMAAGMQLQAEHENRIRVIIASACIPMEDAMEAGIVEMRPRAGL